MIGLDTKTLLRLALNDDASQQRRVERVIANSDEAFSVNLVVLVETAWTLTRRLKQDRTRVADILMQVLETDRFVVQHETAAWRALDRFRTGRADFADYLLAEVNLGLGCGTTVTFDVDALDSAAFSPVP